MEHILQFAWLIPLLPLVGFLINGLGRKWLSKSVIATIGSGVILASFVFSLILFLDVRGGQTGSGVVHYFDFIRVGNIHIPFDFQVDALSSLFLLIITGVGFLIHVYSASYMHSEPTEHYGRYFAYLNLFVFSMLLLVMGANFVVMFIGWEGVGLCSYLLIGFWFKNNDYNYAARKAFVMNRIGDLGFLLAVFWLFAKVGSANYSDVFSSLQTLSGTDITIITLLLFVGATGKSAQIPLYTWLPDAMAGPTPVSALIHAATMVTAGIYMIARSNVLFTASPVTQTVITVIGLATALLAASIALRQNDIKKVLAYSTVSQLGYMFIALGTGAYVAAVFHVMTHAFFKALLFLGSGSVIHAMGGEQDIRRMGGLKEKMPITYWTFLIGCIAIAGIPPFSGFFSKDAILLSAFAHEGMFHQVVYYLALGGAMLTAFYMFRLFFTTFHGSFRGTHEQEHHLHESPAAMTIPLVVLAILSIVGGWVGIPEIIMEGGERISHFLAPVIPLQEGHTVSHSTEWMLMGTSTALVLLMIGLAWNRYAKYKEEKETALGKTLGNKWYVDELYDKVIVHPITSLGNWLEEGMERTGIDAIVNNVGRGVQYLSRQIRLVQSGQVGSYVLLMVVSILLFFVYQFFIKK
ncbi:MAG: NADH-quinone oxidoreductase subunit L [Chitinophagaceae bacterium]|nr:NADH-quinone oxidoreductase subunit L [Chitinophagaceae bacterium]